ncbi:MAG: HAD-IA family hydrolase [Ruminococcus sp.]|nr:HAD-IA family hydrolase [Ruminococcus sp.]
MIKLVAFDLDGTLADTLADLANAVNDALSRQSLPTYPVDDYRRFVGNGVDNLIRVTMADAYSPEGAAQAKADFQRYYADHCRDYTAAYGGLSELLQKLSNSGIKTAVISNKPDTFVPEILAKLYPSHHFFYAHGQQDNFPRKPSPEALNKLITLSGVKKSETLYVGDSDVDVIFAHNAGVKVCGVSWGFRGTEELQNAGADVIVYSAEELYNWIKRHQ